MEPKTPSGITVTYKDGTSLSLESHIALEEDRQKSKEVKEDERQKREVHLYHKPLAVTKGNGKMKKVTKTKVYSQEEINKMTWKDRLENSVKKEDVIGAIVAVLMSGEDYTVSEWVDTIWGYDLTQEYISKNALAFRVRYLINKSPLGKLLEKGKREKGNVNTYTLVPIARNLSMEELRSVYYKRSSPVNMEEVFAKHPELHHYLTEKKEDIVASKQPTQELPVEEIEGETIAAKIGRVIGDSIGVMFSGSVDINVNITFKVS